MLELPPTERIYRTDSYAREFSATVLAVTPVDQRLEVILDRTAFYPTAGGQANDLGTLAGFKVLDVRGLKSETTVVHVLDTEHPYVIEGQAVHAADVLEVGETVRGRIDWARRFDLMQQHTGEHILGQAFFRLNAHVIAVNMEREVCTLDLLESIDEAVALEAETIANRAIWDGHEIACYEVADTDIAKVPLRRAPKVSGLIRVVQIGTFDYSACGGTHLSSSSQVGVLKVLKLERVKGGATRVSFICGERCLDDYRFKHGFVSDLGLRFSSAPEQVPARTETVFDELAQVKRDLAGTRASFALMLGSSLIAQARGEPVAYVLEDAGMLLDVAKVFSAQPGAIGILGARAGERAMLGVACGPGLAVHAGEVLKVGLEVVGGKGGGKPDLAQGSGPNVAALEDALVAMRKAIGR